MRKIRFVPWMCRIYEPKEDGKTKNDHFRELLRLAKGREVKPETVIADSWYSSLNNLKFIRDLGWNWVMGLRKNRVVNRGQKLDLEGEFNLKIETSFIIKNSNFA